MSWRIGELCRAGPQGSFRLREVLVIEASRAARALTLGQAGQSVDPEALYLVHDRVMGIPQQLLQPRTRHRLGRPENTMEPKVITGGVAAPDPLLKGHDHVFVIRDSEGFHRAHYLSAPVYMHLLMTWCLEGKGRSMCSSVPLRGSSSIVQ